MSSPGRHGHAPAVVEAAHRLADDLLLPRALEVDRSDSVPASHLGRLAEAGLYGAAGPGWAGGLDLDQETMGAVIEALAGGCLATTFVWLQHHGLVRDLSGDAPAHLRDEWLAALCRGERRAGVVLAGLLPGQPRLRAEPAGGGWVLNGDAAWVTGWGLTDVLRVAARGPEDTVVWLVVDATQREGLAVRRQRLVAVDASRTVRLSFDGFLVPAARHLRTEPYREAAWSEGASLRLNGFLALGVAARCYHLMGAGPVDHALAPRREALLAAGADAVAEARADASALAVQAASAFVVTGGSGAVLTDHHAQRLYREAAFLLVFGSRPAIRAALLERLAGPRPSP